MDSSHVAIGTGAISGMGALTTILTGFHGLDGEHAAAWAWLICAAVGAASAGLTKFIKWRWPSKEVPAPPQLENK